MNLRIKIKDRKQSTHMKSNFKAWDIKIEDFFNLKTSDKKLRFLLNFAVLAPSSHNIFVELAKRRKLRIIALGLLYQKWWNSSVFVYKIC